MTDGTPSRLTWIGHATVLVELGGVRVLTDPVLRSWLGHLRRHGPAPAPASMRDLDAVLISHLHLDHLDIPSLRQLDPSVTLLVPRGAGAYLRRMGFAHARELAVGERTTLAPSNGGGTTAAGADGGSAHGAVTVRAVPAVHDGRRQPLRRTAAETIGFVLEGPRTVYFAGDTDIFDGMADLADALDVALIPVWGWGPTLGEGHLDPERAARAAALLAPRVAVPIHWGTFYPRFLSRVASAPLRDPPHAFAAQVAELAPDVEVRVLSPGGSTSLAAE
jgi:L-ascorbate metabolism protein UlaG (beta-lactamase superfamily)